MALIVQKFGGTSVGTVERIEQVADKVWESVHPTTQDKLLHRTSYTVGLQTTVLANAAKFVPNFVSRTINKYLAQS